MLATIKNWLKDKSPTDESNSANRNNTSGRYRVAQKSIKKPRSAAASTGIPGADAKQNTDSRPVFVREETSTHETLKIIDSSLADPEEENGIDPYNTGGFDRSKSWNNRFRS